MKKKKANQQPKDAEIKETKSTTKEAQKRKPKTVGECKLGLTIVLDHQDLQALGIPMDAMRKEAHATVRTKLELPVRGKKEKA